MSERKRPKTQPQKRKNGPGRPRQVDPDQAQTVVVRFRITPAQHQELLRRYPGKSINLIARGRLLGLRVKNVAQKQSLSRVGYTIKRSAERLLQIAPAMRVAYPESHYPGQINTEAEQLERSARELKAIHDSL